MICSVPHTGTRTLVKHLRYDHFAHYGQDDIAIAKLKEHIHFPMRDPLAVTISWTIMERGGHPNSADLDEFDEFRRWDLAIKHLKTVPHTIHKIEDLSVVDGASRRRHLHDWYQERNMEKLKERVPAFNYLLDWYKDREDFFKPYYGTPWWLK